MRRLARAFVVLLATGLVFGLAGCERERAHNEKFLALGTIIDVTVYGTDEKLARQAAETLRDDFEYIHVAWNAWHPGTLGRINQLLPTGHAFTGSPSILPLILKSRELEEQSGGRFNPAIGNLIALWGFHSDEPPQGPPPAEDEIRRLVEAKPSLADVEIDGVTLRSINPEVKLDFGAFAKGYGIDLAVEHLRELGVTNAIVNAGGDLRAIGRHGTRPWRIGIRHPRAEGVIASIEIKGDESVFTSGDYERFFMWEGRRYHHIIDPHSGYPADNGSTSVTVLHHNAAEADAAATALFIAGPAHWHGVARAMGIRYVMLMDNDGTVHMNPAMAERIRFEIDPAPTVVLSEELS